MINVAIIEDNAQYRTAVSIILQLNEELKLQHKLSTADNLVDKFIAAPPDVVLMDIDLPGTNGIEAVWEIRKYWPEMKVLMLTVFEDDEKIFGAIKAGANGYLLKKDSPTRIIDAIKSVYDGEAPMNGVIAAKMLQYFQKKQQRYHELVESNLTERENEILRQLVKGATYKEIADSLFISWETLNSHIKNIYRKLKVHSRREISVKYGNLDP